MNWTAFMRFSVVGVAYLLLTGFDITNPTTFAVMQGMRGMQGGGCATTQPIQEQTMTEAAPVDSQPLCREVGGYEAYMQRTGEVCRLN